MPGVEVLPDGTRRVTLWKRDGIDPDRYATADDKPADSHKNSIERNAMRSVELEKKAERHEELYGPLGGAAPGDDTDGLPQALSKAEELQKSDPNMSNAEAFRRALLDPAIRARYEQEFGPVTQLAKGESAALSRAQGLAQSLQKSDPRMSSAEAFRQAMRTPAIRDAYDRETGHAERVGMLAKSEEARALDEDAVSQRAEQLERGGMSWRAAWAQAITESGHGGGARAAA